MKTRYTYIHFTKGDAGDNYWFCFNNKSNDILGEVSWYDPWKQYCYFPWPETTYNVECLNHIADFLGTLNTLSPKGA